MLVDMTGGTDQTVSMEEMSNLRRQWPTSLLTGMTQRQTDLELLMRECKNRFRDSGQGEARIVDETLFMIWYVIYPIITWTWDSCGGDRCCGVLRGKELSRTALTISA